jgi:hypothetical protein
MEIKGSVTRSREAPLISIPSQTSSVKIPLLFVKIHFNIFLNLLLSS